MSQTDYDAAIAEFLRKRAVTRCPTACVVPTRASVSEADRVALRSHAEVREAGKIGRGKNAALADNDPVGRHARHQAC